MGTAQVPVGRAQRWHVASALPPATSCPWASPGSWCWNTSQGPRARENASHPNAAVFPTLCLLCPSQPLKCQQRSFGRDCSATETNPALWCWFLKRNQQCRLKFRSPAGLTPCVFLVFPVVLVSLSVCYPPPAAGRLLGASGVMQDLG